MELPDFVSEVMREAADHEVFLVFNGDADAEMFHDWWKYYGGAEKFVAWCEDNEDKYAH